MKFLLIFFISILSSQLFGKIEVTIIMSGNDLDFKSIEWTQSAPIKECLVQISETDSFINALFETNTKSKIINAKIEPGMYFLRWKCQSAEPNVWDLKNVLNLIIFPEIKPNSIKNETTFNSRELKLKWKTLENNYWYRVQIINEKREIFSEHLLEENQLQITNYIPGKYSWKLSLGLPKEKNSQSKNLDDFFWSEGVNHLPFLVLEKNIQIVWPKTRIPYKESPIQYTWIPETDVIEYKTEVVKIQKGKNIPLSSSKVKSGMSHTDDLTGILPIGKYEFIVTGYDKNQYLISSGKQIFMIVDTAFMSPNSWEISFGYGSSLVDYRMKNGYFTSLFNVNMIGPQIEIKLQKRRLLFNFNYDQKSFSFKGSSLKYENTSLGLEYPIINGNSWKVLVGGETRYSKIPQVIASKEINIETGHATRIGLSPFLGLNFKIGSSHTLESKFFYFYNLKLETGSIKIKKVTSQIPLGEFQIRSHLSMFWPWTFYLQLSSGIDGYQSTTQEDIDSSVTMKGFALGAGIGYSF